MTYRRAVSILHRNLEKSQIKPKKKTKPKKDGDRKPLPLDGAQFMKQKVSDKRHRNSRGNK